jgi:hypothetical protein
MYEKQSSSFPTFRLYRYSNIPSTFSLQAVNKEYVTKLEEVGELQENCMKQLSHQRYRLGVISNSLKK